MSDKKGTTIFIPDELHRELILLKTELGKDNFSEVIQELLKCYRETHGWSAVSISEKLRHMKVEEDG